MKASTFLSLLMILPFWAAAHGIQLSGRVTDAQTGAALAGAWISLEGSALGAIADETGDFTIGPLEKGTYNVIVKYLGYQDTTLRWLAVAHQAPIQIALHPAAINMQAVEIHGAHQNPLAVATRLDLKLRPVNSSQDLLQIVPGLFIAQHAGGGKAEQIFLRGFDIDHGTDIRISVDGLPVNMPSHAHGQGYADLHFLIPETVGGMEFGKGPYDAREGNLATAGHVRFRTLSSLDNSLVKTEIGAFGTWRALAMIDLLGQNAKAKGHSLYVAAERMHTRGYFEAAQAHRRTNALLKAHIRLKERHALTASLSTFGSTWDASGQVPERAVNAGIISHFGAIDSTEGGSTARHQAQLELRSILPGGSILKQQAFAIRYGFDLFSNFTFFLEDSINGDQIWQHERRTVLGHNLNWTAQKQVGQMALMHSAGTNIRIDNVQDIHLAHTLNRNTLLASMARGDVHEANYAAWAEEHMHLGKAIEATAGLRHDLMHFKYIDRLSGMANAQWAGRTSPKLTIQVNPLKGISWFAMAGTGFHSNDSRVAATSPKSKAMPMAFGTETGFIAKPIPSTMVKGTVWHLAMQQEFVYVGDAGVVEPGAPSRRAGIDISLRSQLAPWLFLDLDYNFARPRTLAEDGSYSLLVPLAPIHSAIGGLTFQHQGFSGNLRFRWLGDRPANEDGTLDAQGHFLLSSQWGWESKRLELGLQVDNLLNTLWREAQFETESRLPWEQMPVSEIHYTPGTPRSFRIKAGLKF